MVVDGCCAWVELYWMDCGTGTEAADVWGGGDVVGR